VRPLPLLQWVDARAVRLAGLGSAVVLTANLLYLGSGPGAVNLFTPPWDKVAHFTVFATLAGFVAIGVGLRRPWIALGTVMLIGLVDELHQRMLPGRSADPNDWLVDAAAALVVVAATQALRRSLESKPTSR